MSGLNPDPENNVTEHDSGDESTEDESEVLEESPCGRWQKRREEVSVDQVVRYVTCFLKI